MLSHTEKAGLSKIREEVRRRFPRLTMSLVIAVVFWAISIVVPTTVSNINIPSINLNAAFVVWIITISITLIFLIRALSDALVLGDILTDIFVKRLGIKGERSPKRAARDLIYIIIIILIAMAVLPVINVYFEAGGVGQWLSAITIYVSLGIILILIYDVGRILYRIIEQRAETIADRLSKVAEKTKTGE